MGGKRGGRNKYKCERSVQQKSGGGEGWKRKVIVFSFPSTLVGVSSLLRADGGVGLKFFLLTADKCARRKKTNVAVVLSLPSANDRLVFL